MKIKINTLEKEIETIWVDGVPCLTLESLTACSMFSDKNSVLDIAMAVVGNNIEPFSVTGYKPCGEAFFSYAFPRVEACLIAQAIEFGLGYHLHEAWSEAENELKDRYYSWTKHG